MNDINIYTSRLKLRSLNQQDANAYFKLYQNPQVHCFQSLKLHDIDEAYDQLLKKQACSDNLELAICLKENDEFIGHLFGEREDDTFGICWNLLAEHGKKGYAYEAAYAYMDFLFKQKNIRRIYAYVEEDNIASQKLCQKLGMRQEGLFKEFITFIKAEDGTPIYENTMQYAILKKEWDKKMDQNDPFF